MKRGELYRVRRPDEDPKRSRIYAVVSRDALIATRYASVICAPVFSQRGGHTTEVEIGVEEGLKHPSAIQCDSLASLPKSRLTDYVGMLGPAKLADLRRALRIALDVE
jgi:mRNA interferase MazF